MRIFLKTRATLAESKDTIYDKSQEAGGGELVGKNALNINHSLIPLLPLRALKYSEKSP